VSKTSALGKFLLGKKCTAMRARENEASNINKHTETFLYLQCAKKFEIVNGSGDVLYKTEVND
jgi:hypothetical protein